MSALAGLAIGALPEQASAQTSDRTAANDGAGEIIVTARKREERLQDVPISIAAYSADDIETMGLANIVDLGTFTPGVTFSRGTTDIGGAGNAIFFIRGIGQLDYAPTVDQGVGLYIDGVYLGRVQGAVMELSDIERLEVLRGPQGTLFGKNTIGGAVNVTTRGPDETFSGYASVTLGEDSRQNFDGYINVPLASNLFGSLSFASRDQDGFIARPLVGDVLGEEATRTGRAQLLFEPDSATTVLLSADYTTTDANSNLLYTPLPTGNQPLVRIWNALVGVPSGTSLTVGNTVSPNFDTSFSTGPMRTEYDGGGASLRIEREVGDVTFRSISAYREFDARDQRDNDGSPAEFAQLDYRNGQSQFSQEFNIIGSALNERLDYTLGLYYFEERAQLNQTVGLGIGLFDALEALPTASVQLSAAPCPGSAACAGGPGNPLNIGLDVPREAALSVDATSYAAFAEVEFALTERLSAILGARYTFDDKEYDIEATKIASGVFQVTPTRTQNDWTSVNPRLGLTYQASSDLLLYGMISSGYKAGGFNARPANAQVVGIAFDPEEVLAYELGFKSELFDGRLRFNLSSFYYDYQDIQLNANGVVGNVNVQVIDNVGEATFWGFESEVVAQLSDDVTLSTGVAYLDAEYQDASTAITGVAQTNALPNAPEWKATASFEYSPALFGGEGLLRLDYAFASESYPEVRNQPTLRADAHSIVNARLGWRSSDERVGIAIYAKNLFDERFVVGGFDTIASIGQVQAFPNEPREAGVQLTTRF